MIIAENGFEGVGSVLRLRFDVERLVRMHTEKPRNDDVSKLTSFEPS